MDSRRRGGQTHAQINLHSVQSVAKTEKTKQLFPPAASQGAAGNATAAVKRKGYGRTGAANYTGAKRVRVTHPQLPPGDACPGCKQGKLYALKQLGQIVRITAQPRSFSSS